MDYTPPQADSILFDLAPGYNVPLGDEIHFDLGSKAEIEWRAVRPFGTAFAWGKLRKIDTGPRIPWSRKNPYDRSIRLPMATLPAVPTDATRLPWAGALPADTYPTRLAWKKVLPFDQSVRAPWINLDPLSNSYRLPWGGSTGKDISLAIPWFAGHMAQDFICRIPWGALIPHDQSVHIPWWNTKPWKDIIHRNFWGRQLYRRICLRAYEPPWGGAIHFDLVELLSQTWDGDQIHFWFDELSYDPRCSQREPSGWRDNHHYVRPKTYPTSPKLRVLWTMNTALLTRVLDGAPVEAFSMELAADIDSWCWSFTARVPEASLPLVMPLNEPVAVEATINGYQWIVLIESWSESHSFARREYTIRGRSQSAMLAEPYAPARASSNEQATLARQLAEAELQYTDFTVDWGIVDWLVSAGALSYSNATPLKVIQQIAEAAGGRIISHRTDKQLIALPRLHSLPWTWGAATPDLGISDYVVRQLSREFQPNPVLNAVFISGENQGVLCKVVRSGTAANLLGPMVTDALITDVEPARERGKMIIGQSGRWSKEQLELPLTVTNTLPGLLEIGQLISMSEYGQTWRGQVVGVRVSADFSGGFRVSQHIDVERYRGN